ncbi:OLC1v1017656C1 [Oldenlandia corymbosa var. corymbosa]|uniref:Glycosyltransferase n=1 Tax=Oldenlandia corymbosa var. corymbosa TaxID=529605 RepID=A0AAV1E9W2_OLDCO|nr:OLC1v1017656C1 [Oldenlandia corymbosa var. corymbosa]
METDKSYGAHVVLVPYHGQGHINPMVQFAKRLASKGIKITIATISSKAQILSQASGSFTVATIYDDDTEGGVAGPGGFRGFLDRFEAIGSKNLIELIEKHNVSEHPVRCLVHDADMMWASTVAAKLKIPRAAFFTQSCAAIGTYYPMHCDIAGKEVPLPAFTVSGLPKLRTPHLPSLGSDTGRYSPLMMHILRQFDSIDSADWVLFNSFDKLEEEVIRWLSRVWRVRTIGPTVPSAYLDKRVETDVDYVFNIHNPKTDTCLNWLNKQKMGSVVYISYGSVTTLSVEQIAEIAETLRRNSYNFLWVVKPSEESKLPSNCREENSDKGLVVTWCPQLEVLAHDSVGCFVSHCGWNSTMEAISFGVPVVAIPQFLDQIINAHLVEHVWRVGVVCKADESNGFICGEELERSIKEVMNGSKGEEIRKNARYWKELAKEAVSENGSSDKCIDEMVVELVKPLC